MDEAFPHYIAIGMSPSDYWDGPCEWAVSYRKAHEEKRRMNNEHAWLQGAYVYHAIARIAPALGFGGGEVSPYVEEPFPIWDEPYEDEDGTIDQAAATAAARQYMEVFMTQHNKTIKSEGGEPE